MNTIKVLAAGLVFAVALAGAGSVAAREKPARLVPARDFIQLFSKTPAQLRGIGIEEAPSITTTILFEYNSTAIADEASRQQLAAAGTAFNDEALKSYRFIIEGHTDARGAEDYNLKLSQARAEAIVDILVQQFKVARERLQPIGKGKFELLDRGGTEAAHQKNRRVVFIRAD